MTSCGQITRAGITSLIAVVVLAMPGCGFLSDLCPSSEITPTEAISDLAPPAADVTQPTDEHFVMNWLLLGPFTFDADDFGGGQQQSAGDTVFVPGEADLNGTQQLPEGAGAAWTESAKLFASDNNDGRIALEEVYPDMDHAAVYAVGWVHCPEEITDATLLTGSDDYITVWINGELVLSYNVKRRAGMQDQDVTESITLKKGYNRIVVKCVDVVLGWNFYLRFADKDFTAIVAKPRAAPAEK